MEPVRRTRLGLGISAVVGLLVAFAVFALTRRLSRRIDALAAERDAQKQKLDEANRMEQFRREFVENVSHEIKTPHAGVVGAVEMLVNGQIDADERLSLTPGEYRLLELFLSRPNRIHTRSAILNAIQTETKDVTDRLVDVMLVALRRKLGAWSTHIETVRGVGYRLA